MDCEICGEKIKYDNMGFPLEEVGEFWVEETESSVIAHAQCGLDAGLPIA